MKVGSLVYATEQGLGRLAKSFHDHGVLTDVLIVAHGTHPTQGRWYPDAPILSDLRRQLPEATAFCRNMDAVVFFETPFLWELLPECRRAGVKTTFMPMYECFQPHRLQNPEWLPDQWWCPSLLDLKVFARGQVEYGTANRPFEQWSLREGGSITFTPVPVEVPWRQRTRAEVFVHNAGHGGLRGRNGTRELYTALQYVKAPIQLILRYQERTCLELPNRPTTVRIGNATVHCRPGTAVYEALWEEGDVFVFPEKFNGLSLPLQEARAAGMLVMATDRFPINAWLPNPNRTGLEFNPMIDPGEAVVDVEFLSPARGQGKPLLIKPSGTHKARVGGSYMEVDEAEVDPREIAATIDAWYGTDLSVYSLQGKVWAEGMSWDALGPKYLALLEGLCNS